MARMMSKEFLGGKRPCYCCNGTTSAGRRKEEIFWRREAEIEIAQEQRDEM